MAATSKFGLLSKLEFLQDFASSFIAGVNPAVIHNLEKYYALKKAHYLSAIEGLEGDYLEFGVFTGSSLCHSIRCCRKMAYLNPVLEQTRFYGFDSFAGFGTVSEEDRHPFYQNENFSTSFEAVKKRVERVAGGMVCQLVPGFFSESLGPGPAHYGITKARVVFIDSDTYSSAHEALTFCLPIVQPGTIVILDDFFSYRGSKEHGVARAFDEFVSAGKLVVRHVLGYGMGGAAYIVSRVGG